MNRSAFSIILLALIAHLCVPEIVVQTSKPEHLTLLHDAVIDILMTCYQDPGSAIGIVGDSDGSILNTLRSKYFIPVVLINDMFEFRDAQASTLHELQVFVIATDSAQECMDLLENLHSTMWWNKYANFHFIDANPNFNSQCSEYQYYVYIPLHYGLLNAVTICYHPSSVWIFNSNPFLQQAPPVWTYRGKFEWPNVKIPTSVFNRKYRNNGQTCEALNFPKTTDIGGWPLTFLTKNPPYYWDNDNPETQMFLKAISNNSRQLYEYGNRQRRWFMDNLARNLNATPVLLQYSGDTFSGGSPLLTTGLTLSAYLFSFDSGPDKGLIRDRIFPLSQEPLFAVTKYTRHISQLTKILSVIDKNSRIGVAFVYLITFIFFKIFLGQAAIPALLNLVRLTCNTGLPKLPQNLAPTIYLACLLMFVVTLQGIYTGNLATLLTTTIAYKNVETKRDIPNLGYSVYARETSNSKLAADPIMDGHIIEIPQSESCADYVLTEPMGACVEDQYLCVDMAIKLNLHVSRDPIIFEYKFYCLTSDNPLGRRLDFIMKTWFETGVRYPDQTVEKLRLLYLYDDEIKKNTDRRVMTLDDLCFAFVILGVGLLGSFICFIGEIVIYKIRLKIAKRRNRVHEFASGVNKNSFSSFRSLYLRFNTRRFFSKRR